MDHDLLPRGLAPMLATAGPLPDAAGWAYEVKWDGVRALVAAGGDRLTVRSRVGNDVTASYPELHALVRQLGARQVVLDGEVVALGPTGTPDFGLLQSRMHVARPPAALLARTPVTLLVFDLLHEAGAPLLDRGYDERRAALDALDLAGPAWQVPPAFHDGGPALLASTREQDLEGVVAKRRDSRYRPGRRSEDWVKVKHERRQSALVIGWQPGEGGRAGRVGSLLLAVHLDGGPSSSGLVFVGHVGTGFSAEGLRLLGALLAPLAVAEPACAVPREHARTARWVRPELVAEVAFTAWTRDGRLRHPSFKGLRDDLDPASVVRE